MAEERNPFAAPRADSYRVENAPLTLASRGARFGGYILDIIMLIVLTVVPILFLDVDFSTMNEPGGISDEMAERIAIGVLIGMGVFLLINTVLLVSNGQTIGKKMVGIRVVRNKDGEKAGFWRIVFLRNWPMAVISIIIVYGLKDQIATGEFSERRSELDGLLNLYWLIDPIFIFGSARRCLHDYFGGTRVVIA